MKKVYDPQISKSPSSINSRQSWLVLFINRACFFFEVCARSCFPKFNIMKMVTLGHAMVYLIPSAPVDALAKIQPFRETID